MTPAHDEFTYASPTYYAARTSDQSRGRPGFEVGPPDALAALGSVVIAGLIACLGLLAVLIFLGALSQ